MIDRDPFKFLASLTDAFRKRLDADSALKPQFHYFAASMEAVSVRFSALDTLAAAFPNACVNANLDLKKRQEQHQILFDFFSNAWAAAESFYFGSYFVGYVLGPANFTFGMPQNGQLAKLRRISPKETVNAYSLFELHSAFTKQLQDFLDSDEYKLLDSMRNLLVHRLIPGRTISVSTVPGRAASHLIGLDTWYDGEVNRLYGGSFSPQKREFELNDNCLLRQRDWLDASIYKLSEELSKLATTKGLV